MCEKCPGYSDGLPPSGQDWSIVIAGFLVMILMAGVVVLSVNA